MIVTTKDREALELLEQAETRDPPGLAESNVTSAELGTIYHATARRLAGTTAREAGSDRWGRTLYRITSDGRTVLAGIRAMFPTPTTEGPTP